jgi:NAD(P)-dependent dehydrogenase (short-subunit alcohol dehydrogenase family)
MSLEDRVVVITGAGRSLGRAYALHAAELGAKVVVNDNGCGPDGRGEDPAVAQAVVDQIVAAGGTAIAHTGDARTVATAEGLLQAALESFGRVDGLVANAGLLRDRMFANMPEEDWDAVIEGQLRSTFAVNRVFAAHWRARSKAGEDPRANIVNVSSTSGLIGAVGQTNYGAAKAGIAALSLILAQEAARYGVKVNAITPVARTRMTEDVPGIKDMVAAPADPSAFDVYDPANVAPMVCWLLGADCPVTGEVFYVKGGEIRRFAPWSYDWTVDHGRRWSWEELDAELRGRLGSASADGTASAHA